MSLLDFKERYHVKLDACRDPFIRCRPNAGITLDEASVFEDGPDKYDIWIFDTGKPTTTSKALIARLERHGIKAAVSQQGDREVIVRVIHGGDLDVQLAILKIVHADRMMDLSEEERERRREHGRKMKGNLIAKTPTAPRIDAETPARVQTPPERKKGL